MMEEIPDPTIPTLTRHQDEDKAQLTSEGCTFTSGTSGKQLKVAIIGAGPAGLCAARHLFAPGSGFTGNVYEQSEEIGGTWLYSDATGKDKYGLPIHSTLYYDLMTNLPKETMTYPDFEYKDEKRSYLPAARVLQYLVDYADQFNLHQHIKLQHHVMRVAPVDKKWSVSVLELKTKIEHVSLFDAVMICSGPNVTPVYPRVDGFARFSGRQLHAREYRKASAFEGKSVLIIGVGPSGMDICFYLQPVAKKVFVSHKSHNIEDLRGIFFPEGVVKKPLVTSMQDRTVSFVDGTQETVDVIIHCTGYTYNYPFLSPECGISVDQCVTPLYRHFINIEHPTMCIIGIPRKCPLQYMVDYQVRVFMKILKGAVTLPSKDEMIADVEADKAKRITEGQRKKDLHKMSSARNEEYFKQLEELGDIEPIPPVVLKIFNHAFRQAIKDFANFRSTDFTILDNENFSESSRKVSNVNVIATEQECLRNEKKADDCRNTRQSDGTDVAIQTKSEETESVIQKKVDFDEPEIDNKITSEINDETTNTLCNTVITTLPEDSVVTEKLTQRANCETFDVKALVEVMPSHMGCSSGHESSSSSLSNIGEDEGSLAEKVTNGNVNIDLKDNMSNPICGDEILKITLHRDR